MSAAESHDLWDPNLVYVTGHQRPDTDAIASAAGYAWYLTAIGQEGVVAARAGQPAAQTLFALDRFPHPSPRLLTGVAPTFHHAAHPHQALPDTALSIEALGRVAEGYRIVPVLDAEGRPLGAVTPVALARILSTSGVQALSHPVKELVEPIPTFNAAERISDHRGPLLRSGADDFLVLDEQGRYQGIAPRARVLEPPRARLVLVDHNELSQAVPGAEEAEIIGVLDHHRLGNPPTAAPIPFVVEPVGSTSTLVAELCRSRNLTPPAALAGLLLSGVLSDTLVFRSPTATDRDRSVADWLAGLAGVEIEAYGAELLNAAPGLGTRDAADILEADRKSYRMGERSLTIAQVEVTALQELPGRRADLLAALESLREREALALACLMVTDIVTGRSRLLCRGEQRLLGQLPFRRLEDGVWDLGDMVSRKKQLVPALHAVLADA
jgi:manganese-dependent inorganic pyrophosphatase